MKILPIILLIFLLALFIKSDEIDANSISNNFEDAEKDIQKKEEAHSVDENEEVEENEKNQLNENHPSDLNDFNSENIRKENTEQQNTKNQQSGSNESDDPFSNLPKSDLNFDPHAHAHHHNYPKDSERKNKNKNNKENKKDNETQNKLFYFGTLYVSKIYETVEGIENFVTKYILPLYLYCKSVRVLFSILASYAFLYVIVKFTNLVTGLFKKKPTFRFNQPEKSLDLTDLSQNIKLIREELNTIKTIKQTVNHVENSDVRNIIDHSVDNTKIERSIQDLNEKINQLTALESKFQSAIIDSQRDLIKEISNLRSASNLMKSEIPKKPFPSKTKLPASQEPSIELLNRSSDIVPPLPKQQENIQKKEIPKPAGKEIKEIKETQHIDFLLTKNSESFDPSIPITLLKEQKMEKEVHTKEKKNFHENVEKHQKLEQFKKDPEILKKELTPVKNEVVPVKNEIVPVKNEIGQNKNELEKEEDQNKSNLSYNLENRPIPKPFNPKMPTNFRKPQQIIRGPNPFVGGKKEEGGQGGLV